MKYTLLVFTVLSSSIMAQTTYKVTKLENVKLGATVNPLEITDDYFPSYNYKEAPKHYDKGIDAIKKELEIKYPRVEAPMLQSRSLVDPPVIDIGFDSNPRQNSTPTDNSLAVGPDGTNISVVNSNIQFKDSEGRFIRNFTLESFSGGLNFQTGKFDPRVIYDTEQDKYCMVWLAGFDSNESSIIVAFSSEADVTKEWHLYEIDGSPMGPGLWTDYPMIALTENKLVLTANLIRDNEPWETGFGETLIYQMDKAKAYAGEEELDITMISGIQYGGASIRNLHPVKSADELLESDIYFLSNRNFAVDNDTIFMLHLDEGGDQVEIDVLLADTRYTLPPNGKQSGGGDLSTNDARILDAFRLGDNIQFVGNTLDPEYGKAAIYHGYISDIGGAKNITTRIINDQVNDMAYPGIAWTGISEEENEAIIVAQHSSLLVAPGFSVLYADVDGNYSDWVKVKEGELGSYVDMLNGPTERWGDYIGCQRMYDVPGQVWVSSMYTKSDNRTHTWVSAVSKAGAPMSSTADLSTDVKTMEIFPNPTAERVYVEVNLPTKDKLNISLYDLQGQKINTFFNATPKKAGLLEFSFDLSSLQAGSYICTMVQGGKELMSKKIIKN